MPRLTALRRSRRGVALPMTLLVIALLGGLIASALIVLSGERRSYDAVSAQVRAAVLAESGLEVFSAERSTTYGFVASPPAAYESTRVALPGGWADVVLQEIRPSVGGSAPVYIIRSNGVAIRNRLTGTPRAERTVARYARWQAGGMGVVSTWTSLTGLTKNGGAGTLSGIDQCGGAASVAGVAVPAVPGYTQHGGSSVPTGSPPLRNLGTSAQAAASVSINWDGIVNRNAMTPDVSIPAQPWPASFPASYWPIIKVTGDLTLPSSGHGILVVTGNLTVGGSRSWDGVLLVGGRLTSNGNNTVKGAVVSGLNLLLGQSPPPSDVGNGAKTFRYSSCTVDSALARYAGLRPVANAWVDNWTSY